MLSGRGRTAEPWPGGVAVGAGRACEALAMVGSPISAAVAGFLLQLVAPKPAMRRRVALLRKARLVCMF